MTQSVVGALRVVLGIDTAQFERGLTAAQKQLRDAGRSMQKTGESMMRGGAAMTIGITAPFIALMSTSRQAAIESQKSVGQVEAALNSMGAASGRNKNQLLEQAKALQGLSTFDDDDILTKVTANMLTFGQVHGEVFDRAQAITLDLATRLNTDLQSAAIQVGKALNDPVKGLTALSRVGIQFSDQQTKQIKEMVKSGDVAGAQAIILKELERQYRGAAKAQRDADPDAAARDQWRELQETIGAIALDVLPPLTAALTTVMQTFNQLSPEMQSMIVGGAAIAAALGPVVVVLGAVTHAAGGALSLFVKWGPALRGAAGGTSMLAAAMGGLRAAMMFLVTTPWGLLLTGIAVAIGLLVMRGREATKMAKQLDEQERKTAEALGEFEAAAIAAAQATGEAKEKAEELVKIKRELAIREVEAAQRARETAVALAMQRAELAKLAATEATRSRARDPGEVGGSLGYAAGAQSAAAAAQDDADRAIEDARKAQEDYENLERRVRDGTVLSPLGGGGPGGGVSSSSARSADQARQEAEQRRRTIEDMEHEVALQEAQLRNDQDRVRELERQEAVRQRTRALIDAEILSGEAAAEEAERVQKRLDEAQASYLAREYEGDRRRHDMALNTLEGREDLNREIEDQIHYEERVAFWQGQQLDLLSAQEAAKADMAQLDAARAAAAEQQARAARQQHEIDLARLRGDEREERRLQREAESDARALEYQTRDFNPLDPAEARRRAEQDVLELDDAETRGRFRDFIKDGWRAALDGDLSDFASQWVKDWASRGLEDALNSLADLIADLFRNTDWSSMFGGGGGGGFDWGNIGSSVGSWFKKLPGFANGGSILPGGWGNTDSQLVQFRKSPGERVDIYTPGQDMGGGGGPLHFDLRGAVLTADLLGQMEEMAAASGGAAVRGAREVVPRDQAKADRYSLRGRK